MANILKEVRDINRLKEIVLIVIEEGFEFLIDEIKLKHNLISKKVVPKKSKQDIKPEVRLRNLFERLGPTFIKFGQILSLRPDLIPQSYARELEKLLDDVPPFPYEDVKATIEKEIGQPLHLLFKNFQKKPIASASISQVHVAQLRSGEKVAVKVQRPNIKKVIETDIDIMFFIAKHLENHKRLGKFKPVSIVQEFREWTEKELDFRLEARNAARFYNNFRNSRTVKIPKVYDILTTENVLVLEFIDGTEITKLKTLKKKIDLNRVMRNGLDAVLTMVFEHGLFHADPHPANILVTKDGKIAFVDFGIVGFFDEKLKSRSIDLLYGIVEYDSDAIVDTLISMGMDKGGVDVEKFKADVAGVIEPLRYSPIKDIKISCILEDIISIPLRHNFKIPPQFVMFGKTIVTLEGVALQYDPDFNIVEETKPFLEKLLRKRTSPAYLMRGFMHKMNRYKRFADEFPEKAEMALDKLGKGTFKIDVKDTEMSNLASEIDKSSNRIAYGMIIAALLLTAAITMSLNKGPQLMNVPVIPLLSFSAAIIFGLILFVSIIKEKHREVG